MIRIEPLLPIFQRFALRVGPWNMLKIGVFLLAECAEKRFFTSYGHNLGPTLMATLVDGRGPLIVFAC